MRTKNKNERKRRTMILKKVLLSVLLSVSVVSVCLAPCVAGVAFSAEHSTEQTTKQTTKQVGIRIGVLTPIGLDEEGVRKWSENVAEAEGKTGTFKNPNTMVIYDNLTSMLMALQAKRVDRIALNKATGAYITALNDNFKLNDNHHKPILGYSIAMREEDEKTIELINAAISDMKLDGTLDGFIKELTENPTAPLATTATTATTEPLATSPTVHTVHAVLSPLSSTVLPHFEDVKDSDTIKIAVTGDLPPFDLVTSDGMPRGFNVAVIAELSRRLHKNFELVCINANARGEALLSKRVDALFWTRGVFDDERNPLPYPLDVIEGVSVSIPYMLDSRVSISLKK